MPTNRLFCALSMINFITIILQNQRFKKKKLWTDCFCGCLWSMYCLAHFDQIRRNWFCISQLMTIVAIGLQKPYAKSESGANLVLYNVYWRATVLVSSYGIKIPGIYFHSVESTQIRWFSWWPGGRLVCIKAGRLKGYILIS